MKKLSTELMQPTYLIERPLEFYTVIDEIKSLIGLGHVTTSEVIDHYVVMDRELPATYPYVMVVNCDDERNVLLVSVVNLSDFKGVGKLFEFRFKKTSLTSPYKVQEIDYQIPAIDIFEAFLKLGQTFNKDEEYVIEVLDFKTVGF